MRANTASNNIKADIVIIGGGIAGLWLLNHLNGLGFNAILLEANKLGAGQTLKSQGIIHGGMKYALNGMLTNATESIVTMPEIWRNCLDGKGTINLSRAMVLSEAQYLFSTASLRSKLSNFFASKMLSSRIEAVSDALLPAVLQDKAFTGNAYKLHELVLDVKTVIRALADNYRERLIKIASSQIRFNHGDHGDVVSIAVKINSENYTIAARTFILAAGETNQTLADLHMSCPMQKRPLHMVYLIGKSLRPLYAHCLGNSKLPLLSITTHYTNDGVPVWYVGGKLAEDGVTLSKDEQVLQAKRELSRILPWVDFSNLRWGSLIVNRAEEQHVNGCKPDGPTCCLKNNVITVWPTKLAFAPKLAENVTLLINTLLKPRSAARAIHEMQIACHYANSANLRLPQPDIADYPWDES